MMKIILLLYVGILDACIGTTAKLCLPKQSYVRIVYNPATLCEML
jgi:hypothetical protein